MTDSAPPLPPSHNGLKFAVIGGALVIAALLLLFCSPEAETEPPPVAAVLDAGVAPTSQFQNEFELPPEEPDLGVEDAGPEEPATTMRTRTAARSCEGTIPTSALQAAVSRYQGQVRQCYERALKQNNMLQGRVTVTLNIGASGNVESANASGPLGGAVNACVRSVARSWRLVAPTGGTCATARVPFNMTPGR
jgi:outer membrane biosynthesis protein TonB